MMNKMIRSGSSGTIASIVRSRDCRLDTHPTGSRVPPQILNYPAVDTSLGFLNN